MRNALCVMLLLYACLPTEAASEASVRRRWAQTVLDQVVLRFGGEIVTKLDVRQARMLKLVDVPNDSDEAYVDAIANRRLILNDLKRTTMDEPTAEAVENSVRGWSARVGGGDTAALLGRAGMTETALRAWLKDDLRVQKHITDRFGGRPADLASWVAMLRQRAGLR